MNIYVVGGGASGIATSILIKSQRPDYNVVLLERNDRIGKKLLATGNGRCNYTNIKMGIDNFHSDNPEFISDIISDFDNRDAIELFKTLGINPRVEEDGRVFPLSLQGSAFLDMLRINLNRLGVVTLTHSKIDSISQDKNGKFILKGDKTFEADICILATGGLALPKSGSDGLGYKFAKDTGHSLVDRSPTIVQLESYFEDIKALSGVRIKTSASLDINGKEVDTRFADVLFTDYGLSGPAILDLSRRAIEELNNNNEVQVRVNLVNLDQKSTEEILLDRMKNLPGLSKEEFLIGIVHKKLINVIYKRLEADFDIPDFIYEDEKLVKILSDQLRNFTLNISGQKGYKDAQATRGGVDTKDLGKNLESRLMENLYFVGELVDVDGDCGGYNLQWAWSSAYRVSKDIVNK